MNADCEFISSTIAHGIVHGYRQNILWYRVILKKVSFGIVLSILIAKEEINLTMESQDKALFLCKFLWYLVVIKIIKIGHWKGHISQKIMIWKSFLAKINIYHIAVELVPTFHVFFFIFSCRKGDFPMSIKPHLCNGGRSQLFGCLWACVFVTFYEYRFKSVKAKFWF